MKFRLSRNRFQTTLTSLCLSMSLALGLSVAAAPAAQADQSVTGDCSKTSTTEVSLSPGETLTIRPGTCTTGKVTFTSPTVTFVPPAPYSPRTLTTSGWSGGTLRGTGTFMTQVENSYTIILAPNTVPTATHTFVIKVAPAEPPKEFTTTQKPTITGTIQVGETLTATVADWDPVASMTFVWFAGNTEIGTGKTYLVKPGDAGKVLTVKATGTLATYNTTAVASDPTSAVASIPFATLTYPTISGDPVVGKTLTASITGWSPTPSTINYTWWVDVGTQIGTGSTYTVDVADFGKQITVKAIGSALGYVDAGTSSTTGAVTLPTGLSVTYLANATGTTGSVPVDAKTYTMLDEATVLGSTLARTGYTLAGWNTKADGTGTSLAVGANLTMGSESTTLYAMWTANTYTVTYDSAGGRPVPDGTFTTGGSLALPVAPTPGAADQGRKFLGWFKDPALTQTAGAAGTSIMPGVTENLTLYGGWADYTANFRRWDSASWQYNCNVSNVNFRSGNQVTLPTTPAACDSIRIDGWYSDSGKKNPIGLPGSTYTPTAADQTFYAAWTQRYVTWFLRDGTTPAKEGAWNVESATVTLPTPLVHASGGGVFKWWRDNTAAGKPGAEPGDYAVTTPSFTQRAEAVTLLAIYEYTLSYDLDGGTGGPAVKSYLGSYSGSFNANAYEDDEEEPTKPGYTFAGWRHPAGHTLTDRLLTMNWTYNYVKYGDLKLTAQWAARTNTVTYVSDGATVATARYTTATTFTAAPAPTKAGYTFAGWYDAPTGGTRWQNGDAPVWDADVTLTARWTENPAPAPDPEPAPEPEPKPTPVPVDPTVPVPAEPAQGAQPPGEATIIVDGKPIEGVKLEPTTDETGLSLTAGSVALTITARDYDGGSLGLDAEQNLVVQAGGQIHVSGSGFAPSSVATLYVLSTPRLLGTFRVGPDGSFDATRPFPTDLIGTHTLQITGISQEGSTMVASLGVTVSKQAKNYVRPAPLLAKPIEVTPAEPEVAPAPAPKPAPVPTPRPVPVEPDPTFGWWWAALAGAGAGGLLWFLFWGRRRREEED